MPRPRDYLFGRKPCAFVEAKSVPNLRTKHKPGDIVLGNALAPALVRTDTGYEERNNGRP